MTQFIFDKKPDDGEDEWTTARLADEFFLCLCHEKYYNLAQDLMFRIPLTEQYPTEEAVLPFMIDWYDLSAKVQAEFSKYCKRYSKEQIKVFLKQIVISLFENLDYSYAHMSVMKKLRVRLSC